MDYEKINRALMEILEIKYDVKIQKSNFKGGKQMKRINKDKIYNFIGRAVVYSSLYIATVVFSVWGFLQGMTY